MTASIRILTTASIDSSPSLLIISPDGSKTLINCGEGCQRSFLESASLANADVGTLRVSSVNRVCLTHIGHDTLGGLPGMILTTADVVDTVGKEMRSARRNGGVVNGAARNNNGNDKTSQHNNNNNNNNRKRNHGSLISNNNNNEEDKPPADLEIVGPQGLNTFLHSLRHFMRRDRFTVHTHEGEYDSSANVHNVSANFTAKKKKTKKKHKGSDDHQQMGFNVKSIPVDYDENDIKYPQNVDANNDTSTQNLPISKKQAVSYLFATPPLPGKFRLDKALALNVPRGPMYAQLKAGKSVTFIDPTTNEERTVSSEEVVDKSSPGVCVAIVYCPTLKVLDELKNVDAIKALEKQQPEKSGDAEKNDVELNVIVHLTPKHIFNSPAYQSWCRRFDSTNVDHITLHAIETLEGRASEEGENSPFISGMCGGIRRSFVNDTVYPMPEISLPIDSNDDGSDKAGAEAAVTKNNGTDAEEEELATIKVCPMMDYVLMPRSRRGMNESTVKSLYLTCTIDHLRKKVNESGAVERALPIVSAYDDNEAKKSEASQANNVSGGRNSLGELIFTGTGSAVPCKHRNVTGKYLRMNNGNSMLLDIGEGTVGQLLRSWKSTLSSSPNQTTAIHEYRSRIKGIKAVWISHPHADHHLGLLRLLSERAAICGGSNDPIVLMAPHDMYDFLQEYQTVVPEIKQSYIFVDCYDMIHGRGNPLGQRLYDTLGITNCMSIPVAHCQRSYAVVIDGTSFGRVAYSGDCRPSNRFADVGYGSDLLIHEATFENGMEEDAVLKRHSTVGEAMDVASKMNAKSLVLTHFSQRYPKIPPLNSSKTNDNANGGVPKKEIPIVFAFDFMKLTPSTIDLASKLTPAMRLLYSGGDEEEEDGGEVEQADDKGVAAKELMSVPGVFAAKGVL